MGDTVTFPSATEIHFSRWIAAPLTIVWRAHTEQGQLERWWGPAGFTTTTHEMDMRTGGRWKFLMHGPGPNGEPTDYPNLIQYEEVVPEKKLVWSHGDFETVMFHITTVFTVEGEGTRLDTTMRFNSEAERDARAQYGIPGHESAMAKLESYVRQPHHELSFTRILNAPVAQVWSAWTVREKLMPWFCPKPWQVTACEIDLQPGGRFYTFMQGPNGESHELMSCYLVVEPERHLVWTNALQPGYAPALKPWCTCSVELLPVSDTQTRLTARVMHADSIRCEEHAQMGFPHGWHVALEQMLAMLGS